MLKIPRLIVRLIYSDNRNSRSYLYDWSRIDDEGACFENYVACELRARVLLWQEATGDEFGLFYVRNKQKQETDFLVLRNGSPWLLAEAKLSDGPVAAHHLRTQEALRSVPFVQVCRESDVMSMQRRNVFRISANRLFG